MVQPTYLTSLPTYIPPLEFKPEFPAYKPATSQVERSMSNRLVYADDPWNSARLMMPGGGLDKGKMRATSPLAPADSQRPRGPRVRPISRPPVQTQPLASTPPPRPAKPVQQAVTYQPNPPRRESRSVSDPPSPVHPQGRPISRPPIQIQPLPPPVPEKPRSPSKPNPPRRESRSSSDPPPPPPPQSNPAQPEQRRRCSRSSINIDTLAPAMGFVALRKVSMSDDEDASPPPRASPYNIPYSYIANISNNGPLTAPLRNPFTSPSPPSRTVHPPFLVPGAHDAKPSRLKGLSFETPTSTPPSSSIPPSRKSGISPETPTPILTNIWAAPSVKSPGSQTGSVLTEWEELASPTRTGARSHVMRKVSESTQDVPRIVHVRSVHLKTGSFEEPSDGISGHKRTGAEIYREPSPLEGSVDVQRWEEEDRHLGSAVAVAVEALRRQLDEDEQDEEQWSSVTDLLLQRLTSRSSTNESF